MGFKPMTELPPDLAAFASILDAQPAPVRDAFNYCLCLLMVEAGKMRLVETVPGESGEVCVFETTVLLPAVILSSRAEKLTEDVWTIELVGRCYLDYHATPVGIRPEETITSTSRRKSFGSFTPPNVSLRA